MTLWTTPHPISARDAEPVSLSLARAGEDLCADGRGLVPVDAGVWCPGQRSTRRLPVSETLQAWVVRQYCERFAIWAVWGPGLEVARLSRYATLGDWAHEERLVRVSDRHGDRELVWVIIQDDLISLAMARIMASRFAEPREPVLQTEPDAEARLLREAAQITLALHAIAGNLPTRAVWDAIGAAGQRQAKESESTRLHLAWCRLVSERFPEWTGTSGDAPSDGAGLMWRLNQVLHEGSDLEIRALSLFGLDEALDLDHATWIQVHDRIERERQHRQLRRPRNLFGAI